MITSNLFVILVTPRKLNEKDMTKIMREIEGYMDMLNEFYTNRYT